MTDKNEMETLDALLTCAASWEPDARLVGNVRAGDIVQAIDTLRAQLASAQAERDEARAYAEERNNEANNLQRHLNRCASERDDARAALAHERSESSAAHNSALLREATAKAALAAAQQQQLKVASDNGDDLNARSGERIRELERELAEAKTYLRTTSLALSQAGQRAIERERDALKTEVARLRKVFRARIGDPDSKCTRCYSSCYISEDGLDWPCPDCLSGAP